METNSDFESRIMKIEEAHDSTNLVQRVSEQLREMIMTGKLERESQLPNEPDLAAMLNVSRSTVRSALTILEHGGFVVRRWGVGTFVAKDPPAYDNLNINTGVTQLIQSSGAEVGCAEVLIVERPASEHVASRLGLDPGTPLILLERVRLANDRRIAFTLDYIPKKYFGSQTTESIIKEIGSFLKENLSMYTYMRDRLSIDIHHGIAWIHPVSTENYLAEKLQVARGISILYLEQVDCNSEGEPVTLSDEYYVADAFTFTVYRAA